jgi:hypothetical protein
MHEIYNQFTSNMFGKGTDCKSAPAGGDRDNGNRLSLNDPNLAYKLILEMILIHKSGFKGSNVSDLFDSESLIFGKNELLKRKDKVYEGSIVTITLVNPKFGPDYGNYYQLIIRNYQTIGRTSYGTIDIEGSASVINVIIFNKTVFEKTRRKIQE